MIKGAHISPCQKFRYRLWRTWDTKLPVLMFIMLNPSTADADIDDPTIRKCIGFAQRLGFGGIEVQNLFAYRATDPKELKRAGYPDGPENVSNLGAKMMATHSAGGSIVCAWGANARGLPAPDFIRQVAVNLQVLLYALRITNDGVPWHPLMLPYSCKLERFGGPLHMPTEKRA